MKLLDKKAEAIYNNWKNGNRTDFTRQVKALSRIQMLDLVVYIAEREQNYSLAIGLVYHSL